MAHCLHIIQFPVLLAQLFFQLFLRGFRLFKLAPGRLAGNFQQLYLFVQRFHLTTRKRDNCDKTL